MVLVDSSVWIDFFNGNDNAKTKLLSRLLPNTELATGDLILAEVLQGFRENKDFRQAQSLLASLTYFDLAGQTIAEKSAGNFRRLRKQGITIRKTMDMLIATFCIENKIPLLHNDRDYDKIAGQLNLKIVK